MLKFNTYMYVGTMLSHALNLVDPQKSMITLSVDEDYLKTKLLDLKDLPLIQMVLIVIISVYNLTMDFHQV